MSVQRVAVQLDLIHDVIFSARAASTGAHHSLDHVPGASLLGALAERLYRELERRDLAFIAFHSGRLRFGNGLPLDGESGAAGWPVPLSLHREKGSQATSDHIRDGNVRNLILADVPAEGGPTQWQQLRGDYVTATLDILRPRRQFSMKTAIDPQRGRARDQQLFGYEALDGGQSFLAIIEADEEARAALDIVVDNLKKESLLHLGRSRSAEYGAVRATVLDGHVMDPPVRASGDGRLRLWALSDLCLMDDLGRPATLSPAVLGFPDAEIDRQRSFVRLRRYAPFNGHWRQRGLERVVVCQGSVIVLHGKGIDDATARRRLAAGVGQFRECGLGRVAVNPWILTDGLIVAASGATVRPPRRAEASLPEPSPLIAWLRQKTARADSSGLDFISEKLVDLAKSYDMAKSWAGVQEARGPGPAQWNAVRDAAEHWASDSAPLDANALHRRLLDSNEAVAKEGDAAWGARFGVDGDGFQATFHGWLRRLLEDLRVRDGGLERLLPRIAKGAADEARRRFGK